MKKIFLLLSLISSVGFAQKPLFTVNADSTEVTLTEVGASHLASLPLHCISTEWPNKLNHTANAVADHRALPSEHHPAFYGCLDWHSSVHGHWLLVRTLKLFPELPQRETIRRQLAASLSAENLKKEADYFKLPLTNAWERTYGWAWLLKLDEELLTSADPQFQEWHRNMQPLVQVILDKWMKFIPKETYPNRTGVHPNTAFGRVFALDYAKATQNIEFENMLIQSSRKLFGADVNSPTHWEPNGSDFLSPTLEEIDLMGYVLPKAEFEAWLKKFANKKAIRKLFVLPVVSDRTDYQIVHLDGLCFSRSWCMNRLANRISDKKFANELRRAAARHLTTAIPHVVSGNYGGDHWLASFALYALMK